LIFRGVFQVQEREGDKLFIDLCEISDPDAVDFAIFLGNDQCINNSRELIQTGYSVIALERGNDDHYIAGKLALAISENTKSGCLTIIFNSSKLLTGQISPSSPRSLIKPILL